MNKLTVKEIDLLERVKASPELRVLFFRKVKGLKWFDVLQEGGYFNAENIPAPIPAREAGYVQIPRWDAVEYLVNTVHELINESAKDYVPRFLEIIVGVTCYAKVNNISNVRCRSAVQEMRVGPSHSACRSRVQTTVSGVCQKLSS